MVIGPGQVCTPVGGEAMAELGTRSWGNDADGETVLLTGTYTAPGAVGERLVRALPELVVVPAEADSARSPGCWPPRWPGTPRPGGGAGPAAGRDPGQRAAGLGGAARTGAPGWYLASGDPVVGPALRLVHDQPAEPWSVATMAATVGVSRATLARRFAELVGEPPMSYLTGWRIALAADLLADPSLTVAGIARRVGYASPFALSTAFKRVTGRQPAAHRAALRRRGAPRRRRSARRSRSAPAARAGRRPGRRSCPARRRCRRPASQSIVVQQSSSRVTHR